MKFALQRCFGILLIALLARCGTVPPEQVVSATPTVMPVSSPLAATSAPVSSSSPATAKEPPPCTFPLAQITATESAPKNYTFSEPKVVLTAPGQIYDIIEWLPNNEQVLITVDQYNMRETESDKLLRQSIELYNPETGESYLYAVRHKIDEPPAWQAASNAVIYSDMNVISRDKNTNRLQFTRQVWVSHGNPNGSQLLADNLPQFPLAVKPSGSELAYLSDKQIVKRDASLQSILTAPFDLSQWDYAKPRRNEIPVTYKMAWQPGTSLIFLHSEGGMQLGGGYTFILNADTGQVCELNVGGWAVQARWSPNGRYLAILRAVISSYPVNLTDLVVLDAETEKLYSMQVVPQDAGGKHYVDDFVWAPDNQHLLAVGSAYSFHDTGLPEIAGLYLVDFKLGQSTSILPSYKFYASMGGDNLAWSPDGSKLLIRCPTMQEDRVCLISVGKK